MEEDFRDDYRSYRDYRDSYRDYRDDYRDDYRKYDLRGGKRNYRSQDFTEELETVAQELRELYRKMEDVSEMATNSQEKHVVMKIAQTQKDNYTQLKQIMNKSM